jgi:iron-sulfur cluster assembly protein|tara:strand:+ start:430 stop:741 length:312 start_codon:yes stop_codon:yes gene_type:complete
MISFTKAAEEQLKKAIVEGESVRIAVQGGGCSGMSYAMNIVEVDPDEEDLEIVLGHIKIHIDPHSAAILENTSIDYINTLKTSGFVFNNAAANTTCGCGMSFS